mmetsp:Transcript_18452/g.39647  ORF Transcript_18452/g.39647 Transcript_18452/m.39647 type:complete len:650 (+) Transcript_18452:443-2392(+)|eukprot:CAMPEP_0202902660 /NCGR_PEP_ID=MMETSP1392-20130828/16981_1 /ASSEMBLY_ACC=CAM_ASM_000868 /TAXON_ID=225041 /ORGANISM="Chlamydomonas chlamydogama, Strain SAG 11-48b" /LENGTH=649 /DNA_ID=CAMNT_0049589457 /DNA_START=408 /DNA_END=2357 /DNA_ORIENTATION=-
MSHDPVWCPVYKPSRQDFQRPFLEYIGEIFRKNPDLPMFKVVPPPGWRPRRTKFPDLKTVKINTPIRQHVFGTKGAYRCILVEQKEMTVADFKKAAESEAKAVCALQKKARGADGSEDSLLERSFWSSVTINPPLYGADTPVSFFDEKLPYGWNLRNLGDLLKTRDVPSVPGVTTPMTYFGMWRSFFGWHKEDADLLSINYLHFGAPKVWYCVSPKDSDKFDRMAQSMFPQLHTACPAFVRHKDIMLSPSLLRTYGIPYMQAKQAEGEFIVLNAAAYHSGFNTGFNCAEAVNFATEEWVDVGKAATPCRCEALRDAVRINMKIFDPNWSDPDETSSSEDESDDDSDDSSEEGSDDEEGSEESGSHTCSHNRNASQRKTSAKAPAGRSRAAQKSSAHVKSSAGAKRKRAAGGEDEQLAKAPRTKVVTSKAEAAAIKRAADLAVKAAAAAGKVLTGRQVGAAKARARKMLKVSHGPAEEDELPARASASARRTGANVSRGTAVTAAAVARARSRGSNPSSARTSMPQAILRAGREGALVSAAEAKKMAEEEVVGSPMAIVGENSRGGKFFCLVQQLKRAASTQGYVVLRWLKEGKDGIFRPTPTYWEEQPGSLISVRTQCMEEKGRARSSSPGGWKLLTLKSRILDTELLD